MGGTCSTDGENEKLCTDLVRKAEERCRRWLEDKVEMDLVEIGCEVVDWNQQVPDLIRWLFRTWY
jgi:hypothetical protein